MSFSLSSFQRSGVNFFDLRKEDSLPASWVLANAPFLNSPPLMREDLSCLLPSRKMLRTFIFDFLSITMSRMTWFFFERSSFWFISMSAFL